jgi:integrase
MALLRQMRADVATHGDIGSGQRQLRDSLADYLRVRRAAGRAARTIELDEWMLSVIGQGLGAKRLDALTVVDCDRFLEAAAMGEYGAPIGRSSLTRIRSTLIGVLRNDLRRGLVARNVGELSVMPEDRQQGRERRALTVTELRSLLELGTETTAILIDLSGRNGLRPAEARAVQWTGVDLEAGTLAVDGQMNRANERVAPKTRKAARTIRINAETIGRLRRWRETQQDHEAAAGPAWTSTGLVVTTRSGRALGHRNFHRSLVKLCAEAGIEPPISAYELRHTAITLQAEAGHPAWQIADWAGTSERMITEVYRHRLQAVSPLGPVGEN